MTAGVASQLSRLMGSAAARAGAVLLFCSMAGHIGNYLYYVFAARARPGRVRRGQRHDRAGDHRVHARHGVQAALARDVAALTARGLPLEAQGLIRAVTRRVAVLQAGLLLVLVVGTPAAVAVLGLSSIWVWLVGALWIVLGLGLQISLGTHQGREHFGRVGAILAGPLGVFRPLFLVPLAAVAGVAGALGALVLATVVGLGMSLAGPRRPRAPVTRITFRIGSALVALAAFASLTNLDLLIAKVTLEPTEAGLYASAALLGKVALYGPSALALMLLPKVTARLEASLSVRQPALLTMAATLLTGGAVAVVIVLAPTHW